MKMIIYLLMFILCMVLVQASLDSTSFEVDLIDVNSGIFVDSATYQTDIGIINFGQIIDSITLEAGIGYYTTNETDTFEIPPIVPPSTQKKVVFRNQMSNNTNNEFCYVFYYGGKELCINATDFENLLNVNKYIRLENGSLRVYI